VNQSVEEFKSILKPSPIKILHVQEWANAIPQFHVGHQAILNQLKSFEEKNPSIAFAGNYVSGVSLGDCVEYANNIAQ
jgi:oxygen-dependent protoporphyrinogen oxidase